jgi:peptide/nickel transport system substrate-binding protein
MFSSKKLMLVLGVLVIASMALAACQPAAAPAEQVVKTVVVTQIVEGEPVEVVQVVTPTPEPEGPKTLVVCQGQEPDMIYPYGTDMLAAAGIQEMVLDGVGANNTGGMDNNSFAYQGTYVEKVPSLEDGDAVINSVTVGEGDTVVDANQNIVTLDPAADPPIMIVASGSTDPVEYTGGDVQMDQMAVTFKINPKVTYSDGTPATASDSVYSFNLFADPDSSTVRFTSDRTASYEAADDYTTVWTGLPGFMDQTYMVNFWGFMPEHVWGQYTAAELKEQEVSTRTPLGVGPYAIQEWVAGDSMTLTKNPYYYRADEGLPVFETVIIRFAGENSNANIAALLAGECDIIDQTSGLDDQSELLLELQSSGQLNPTFVTGTTWEHTDFGIQPISYDDGYQQGTDRPDFFSDLRVREAFAMCMDRQALVDTILFGQSIVINNYIPPQHPLYNPDVKVREYDPEGGAALLDEVGWKDDDGDPATPRVAQGVANVPDGTPLVVNYGSTNATLRQQVTAVLQQSLAGCGIQADLGLIPASEWFADGPEGPLFGRRFDLGEFAWLTGVTPPCNLYLSQDTPGDPAGTWIPVMAPDAGPQEFKSGWGGQNDPGFYSPEFDAACKASLSTLPGQPGYEENHKEAQRLFGEELPVVPLFLRLKLAATRPDMCNFIMDPTNNSEFWNVEEFDYGACAGQ